MEIVSRVLSVFSQLDQQVTEFQLKTGLRCPAGCGVCCSTADVQTTILEMMPAAYEILSQGATDDWFQRLALRTPKDLCVFFKVERAPEEPGHCVFYRWRPAICRLFGFAAVHTRTGVQSFAVCRHHKSAADRETVRAVECQSQAPDFSALTTQLYSMEPARRIELLPINEALHKAILRVGLKMQMTQGEQSGSRLATVA